MLLVLLLVSGSCFVSHVKNRPAQKSLADTDPRGSRRYVTRVLKQGTHAVLGDLLVQMIMKAFD